MEDTGPRPAPGWRITG